ARAVAAHRTIEALQIAIHHEDEVVEPVSCGERQPGERLRLVHLAVADERPDLASRGLQQAAMLEIPHEARLVDRLDRPESHRARGKLPELRHQVWVTVGAQAFAAGLLTVVREALLG